MTIYSIQFDVENYRLLVPVDEAELDGGNLWINGTLKLSSWRPPQMAYAAQPSNESCADVTQITPGFFAFNSKAIDALGGLLENNGELLELPMKSELLHAFNPHNEIDCFDKTRALYKTRRNGERGRLLKPAFDESKVGDTELFQVPELLQTRFFVTDTFKQRYEEHGLTGLKFEAVS